MGLTTVSTMVSRTVSGERHCFSSSPHTGLHETHGRYSCRRAAIRSCDAPANMRGGRKHRPRRTQLPPQWSLAHTGFYNRLQDGLQDRLRKITFFTRSTQQPPRTLRLHSGHHAAIRSMRRASKRAKREEAPTATHSASSPPPPQWTSAATVQALWSRRGAR